MLSKVSAGQLFILRSIISYIEELIPISDTVIQLEISTSNSSQAAYAFLTPPLCDNGLVLTCNLIESLVGR